MQTKFSIEVKNGHLKVEIEGKAKELKSLLATVFSEDEQIKCLVLDAMVAAILEKTEASSKDPVEDMLNLMNIKLN